MKRVLTNSWWELLFCPLSDYLEGVKIVPSWNQNYSYSLLWFRKISNVLQSKFFDIVHLNWWPEIFFLKKRSGVKYIFESHGVHPWLSLKYSLICIENILMKIFLFVTYPFRKILFLINIKKIDLYLVSIPWILPLATKIRKDAKWLPNPIDTRVFKKTSRSFDLDVNRINVFYPTWFRDIKNTEYALALMLKLKERYRNISFYCIKQSVSNYKKFKKQLELLGDSIIWLDYIPRDQFPYYYSADRNLVLWSFFPDKIYAVLNLIELEAMACEAPILCCDLNEIIFEPIGNMEKMAYKIIEDKSYKDWYVKRNYDYVVKVHWMENIAKVYEKYIQILLEK